jgi:hypothetical protein
MVQTLTHAGLVVPPLGAADPSEIHKLGEWHWGTRELDFQRELYLFDIEAVARNIIEHGPLFAVSHGGHGINSYALSLVTSAPSGDVAYFTQGGIFGGYSDLDRDRARINAAYLEVAQEWAALEDEANTGPVCWLAYRSAMRFHMSGIIDLDALRAGADFESAHDRIEDGNLFEEVKARRASRAEDARSASSIETIVPHLTEALRRLEDSSHLVIGVHDSIRYVQFATFLPNLRLETIGTRYLEEAGEDVSVDELVWLADHGWHDADDGGNLWRHWIPADENEAAAAAIDALVNVHGVTSLEQVWFQSEDDDALAALEVGSPPPDPSKDPQPDVPAGATIFLLVDYVATKSVLEMLARSGDRVFRRHDGRWYEDPEWAEVLSKAPGRSIVVRADDSLDRVLGQVDRSTAGKPWSPFRASQLEMYWPSYRPNDPDLFDWSTLTTLDEPTSARTSRQSPTGDDQR